MAAPISEAHVEATASTTAHVTACSLAPVRRRVYAETMAPSELVTGGWVQVCARRRLELIAAVRPWQLPEVALLAHAARREDVPLTLWPMLDDRDGRFPSVTNLTRFLAMVDAMLAHVPAEQRTGLELLVDPEPDVRVQRLVAAVAALDPDVVDVRKVARAAERAIARAVRSLRPAPLARPSEGARVPLSAARRQLAEAIAALQRQGVRAVCAVPPLLLLDAPFERALSRIVAPLTTGVPFARASVMLYTTLLEGLSVRLFDRARAKALLARGARRAVLRDGDAAEVSVGAIGLGALESEPMYRTPDELAEDVALARGAGVRVLSLLDLGGAATRGPAEQWLDAFASA
jgi:hypothetical protein